MCTFQIASDLHLEFLEDDHINIYDFITPSADILILAGDIGSIYRIKQLKNFILSLSKHFDYIIYIPGNNEYYVVNNIPKKSFFVLKKILKNLESEIDNLFILDRECLYIDNICICGATLWSYPLCIIPKFIVRIDDMNTERYLSEHLLDLEFIKNTIENCKQTNKQLIIITHHPPTYEILQSNRLNKKKYISLYASHLDYLLNNNNILLWVCGHIHYNFDIIYNSGCRLLSNQKGKPKENVKNFIKDKIINLNF